jgi:hypothetical protein
MLELALSSKKANKGTPTVRSNAILFFFRRRHAAGRRLV